MGTRVRILERFEETRQLGPLVVTELRTGVKETLDGPRARTLVYTKGECPLFAVKKDAEAFVKRNPGKTELIAKCARTRCKKDVAYRGAVYCGAACTAQAEAGR